MARYSGPACRLCRQAGQKLFLKGERCYMSKCAVERRRKPPGEHLPQRRRASDWALQLREKQKMRHIYGVMERQFARYMEDSQRRTGATGELLAQLLERRLDNVVYRLNFGESRQQARQFVTHGHVTVNGRKVDIPSFIVRPGDAIGWRPSSQQRDFVKAVTEDMSKRPIPGWLSLDTTNLTGRVESLPEGEDLDTRVDTRMVVEFYSR